MPLPGLQRRRAEKMESDSLSRRLGILVKGLEVLVADCGILSGMPDVALGVNLQKRGKLGIMHRA